MELDRPKLIGLAVLAALVVFLLGFLPQWSRARGLSRELESTRQELRVSQLEGQLGAALTESLRSNYERSRQLMASFFSGLQAAAPNVEDAGKRREMESVLAQRDEIITLLSRAQPESTQRLMLLYTTFHAAAAPADRPAVTPPTPGVGDTAAPAPTTAPPVAPPPATEPTPTVPAESVAPGPLDTATTR
jgi:hypothetical protein